MNEFTFIFHPKMIRKANKTRRVFNSGHHFSQGKLCTALLETLAEFSVLSCLQCYKNTSRGNPILSQMNPIPLCDHLLPCPVVFSRE